MGSSKRTTSRAEKRRSKQQNEPAESGNRNPRGVYRGNREEWLREAMAIMAVWLNAILQTPCLNKARTGPSIPKGHKAGQPLLTIGQKYALGTKKKWQQFKFKLDNVAVSCSLLSAGMKHGNALAHVQYWAQGKNGKHEIRMGAHLGGRKTKESSARIGDILLHEMIHCCFPMHGHRGGFRDMAHSIGLDGRMTATIASPELQKRIEKEVVQVLGRYPHEAVHLVPRGKRGKGSRLIKASCDCGAIIRMSRKGVDLCLEGEVGYVSCPACEQPMEVDY